jgi:hypothetical protein
MPSFDSRSYRRLATKTFLTRSSWTTRARRTLKSTWVLLCAGVVFCTFVCLKWNGTCARKLMAEICVEMAECSISTGKALTLECKCLRRDRSCRSMIGHLSSRVEEGRLLPPPLHPTPPHPTPLHPTPPHPTPHRAAPSLFPPTPLLPGKRGRSDSARPHVMILEEVL